jgi:hypothetical protein
MLVGELESGMLIMAKEEFSIVYTRTDNTGDPWVRSAPDILAPGFNGYGLLMGGTWMYLGTKKIPHEHDGPPGLRTVHELFHSKGGVFITTGQIFRDLKPLEI